LACRCIRTCFGTRSAFTLPTNGVHTRTIQAYLGHRNIEHTVRYTQLAPERFRALWRD